jgi:Tfp pilus assembly protein PilF
LIDGNHAVQIAPDNINGHQNRGIAFAIANKLDSAMLDFRFVVTHDPFNARTYNNIGNLHMIMGKPDLAIQQYNAALKADPQFLMC